MEQIVLQDELILKLVVNIVWLLDQELKQIDLLVWHYDLILKQIQLIDLFSDNTMNDLAMLSWKFELVMVVLFHDIHNKYKLFTKMYLPYLQMEV